MTAVPVPGAAAPADRWVLAADPSVGPLPDGPAIDPAQRYALADLIDLAERLNPETRIAWDQAREALSAEGLAGQLATLCSGRGRLIAMAERARALAKPRAVQDLADACVELVQGERNGVAA